ncbi:unnamed protein product [Didymodactylos carnosus]|uniref:DNA-directed RNA polymerase n=1 Tax=Didymodactylos carnosus TaxID=1234261 RepID=A0A814GLM4_9BILA|nr:unnamed protein product [Didymodactylos carnosus]CAF3769445.1 unnamed protein product [Didymodactylos carnosus]
MMKIMVENMVDEDVLPVRIGSDNIKVSSKAKGYNRMDLVLNGLWDSTVDVNVCEFDAMNQGLPVDITIERLLKYYTAYEYVPIKGMPRSTTNDEDKEKISVQSRGFNDDHIDKNDYVLFVENQIIEEARTSDDDDEKKQQGGEYRPVYDHIYTSSCIITYLHLKMATSQPTLIRFYGVESNYSKEDILGQFNYYAGEEYHEDDYIVLVRVGCNQVEQGLMFIKPEITYKASGKFQFGSEKYGQILATPFNMFQLLYVRGKNILGRSVSFKTSGFSITAERLNILRCISYFRSVHRGDAFTKAKTTSVRKLHPEA